MANVKIMSDVAALSYKKAVHKMLVKLTPVVNFINILQADFALIDPESVKKDS